MRVIARNTLRTFWSKHADATGALQAWFAEASHGTWRSMADIKRRYATASIIDSERVVFNIAGNKYRLVVKVWFLGRTIWIREKVHGYSTDSKSARSRPGLAGG